MIKIRIHRQTIIHIAAVTSKQIIFSQLLSTKSVGWKLITNLFEEMKSIARLLNGNKSSKTPKRNIKNSSIGKQLAVPQIPSTNIEASPYNGPEYDKLKEIKENNVVPCIQQYYKTPLLIHEGKMQWLFDHKGKRYLDMFGGIVTVSVGHCHPKVNEEAKKQMDKLWHTTNIYMHPQLYEYAEKLTSTLPGDLKVVYFLNSGSEANDLALLLARVYTKYYDIISFRNAYHGASPYVMGVTGLSTWRFEVPLALGFHHAMNPDVYKGLWGGQYCRDSPVQTTRSCDCDKRHCKASDNYYDQLEEVFKHSLPRGKVAGIIAESIQGVGGVVQFPKGFLKKAFELVRSNGGICIIDEVQSGFGRTGEHFWGFESHGVIPDIVTMAKGIGNGFPLSALVTTPKIAEVLGHTLHFNTFGGNPIATAVGRAVLEVIEKDKLQQNCAKVGTYLLLELAKLRDEFDSIGDVRGKGLMIGVELVSDKLTRSPLPAKHFVDIWEDCKEMGVLLGRGGLNGNVIRIKPPMCINKEDADFTIAVLRRALYKHHHKNKRL